MPSAAAAEPTTRSGPLQLFLCGDVMTGRGIDQVLPHPGDPELHEPHMKNARGYVALAERAHGPISKPVSSSYVWGEAQETLAAADVRIINLETAVTATGSPASKDIHYRMHPRNIGCIMSARIDCCVLANNHMLDWGRSGLSETLEVLHRAGLRTAGAGENQAEAARPAIVESERGRVLVFGLGRTDSGIPRSWAASDDRPGVNLLTGGADDISRMAAAVGVRRRRSEILVASIHWGGNWGYRIPSEHRELAHRMIEEAGVDVVHGHSSHHVKGIEVHRGRLILYGCGDFINDYEGIGGYKRYRSDLAVAYLASVSADDGSLTRLRMVPYRRQRFRLHRGSPEDARWLSDLITREGKALGTRAEIGSDDSILLRGLK